MWKLTCIMWKGLRMGIRIPRGRKIHDRNTLEHGNRNGNFSANRDS